MSHRRGRDRDDRSSSVPTDAPPMSRLFIICSKSNTEDDVRSSFEKFGTIEEINILKDRVTAENKGIAYVKFTKTSEAAIALEEMNGKYLTKSSRPIKVLVAASRQQGSSRSENEHEKNIRLFVLISKDTNEQQLTEEFESYGEVDSVSIIRDKLTKESKGYAYIKFFKFSHAAVAFESCDGKYKAVFAEPKGMQSQNSGSSDRNSSSRYGDTQSYSHHSHFSDKRSNSSSLRTPSSDFPLFSNQSVTSHSSERNSEFPLNISCSKTLNQDQLWRLFDIVPGLEYCKIIGENGHNSNDAIAVYSNIEAAQYAREKIHGLEYPLGERMIIKPMGDHPKGNVEDDDSFCSAKLPAPKPQAPLTSKCAQRLFIVCIPKLLPQSVLINVFSRFGDLIEVFMLPNKQCGYVKYASETSASQAISTLNGADVCGVKLKVVEADERDNEHAKRKRYDLE